MKSAAFVSPVLLGSHMSPALTGRACCVRHVSSRWMRVPQTARPVMTVTDGDNSGRPRDAKELAARYGGAYLGTSIALSLVSFGVLYALIAAGFDVRSGIEWFGDWLGTTPLGRPAILDSVSDSGGTFALAYVAHKVTSPIRFPPTLVVTEMVAKAIGQDKLANAGKDQNDG